MGWTKSFVASPLLSSNAVVVDFATYPFRADVIKYLPPLKTDLMPRFETVIISYRITFFQLYDGYVTMRVIQCNVCNEMFKSTFVCINGCSSVCFDQRGLKLKH